MAGAEIYLTTLQTAAGAVVFIIASSLTLGGLARLIARWRGASRVQQENSFAGYLFAAPWITGFIIFVLGPMLASLYWSFTKYSISADVATPTWIGLANYTKLLTADKDFASALYNTLYMTVIGLPMQLLAALFAALLLSQKLRGERVFRAAFYMPVVLAGSVATLLSWRLMLNPNNGVINTVLGGLGRLLPPFSWVTRAFIWFIEVTSTAFEGLQAGNFAQLADAIRTFPALERVPLWLQNPLWAKPSIVLLLMWGCGQMMLVYLAALYNVPPEIHEAAEVDGAGGWKRFRYITLPLISPYTFFNLVTGIIATLQIFEASYALAVDGGPGRATYFVAFYLWRATFRYNQIGFGAAMSWLLFGLILIVTAIQFGFERRWVTYDIK